MFRIREEKGWEMGWLDDTVLKMGGKFFEIRKFLKCAHVPVAREGVVMFKRMCGG